MNEDDKFGISKDLLEDVLSCLRRDYPRELVPVILAPILYKEQGLEYTCHKMAHESSTLTKKNMVDSSLANLILETRYSLTSNWKEVVYEMDHPRFLIRDMAGLRILLTALQLDLQTEGATFPAEVLYQSWSNAEGQL